MPYPAHGGGFFCGGRDREHGFSCGGAKMAGGHGRRMTVAEHRLLRSLGQGSAGFCRTLPAQSGNAPPQSASPPAPLAGEPLGRLPPHKASPARGGGCAAGADGGVRRLAPQISFRAAGGRQTTAHPCAGGADDFRLPARFALAQGSGGDASIVPYAARIKALPDFAGHSLRKAAMHPSVGFAASSPCRGAFGAAAAP